MTIDYEPWGESHAPKRFERTDKSGRWSPLYEKPSIPDQWHDKSFPEYMMWMGGLAFGGGFAILLSLMFCWGL